MRNSDCSVAIDVADSLVPHVWELPGGEYPLVECSTVPLPQSWLFVANPRAAELVRPRINVNLDVRITYSPRLNASNQDMAVRGGQRRVNTVAIDRGHHKKTHTNPYSRDWKWSKRVSNIPDNEHSDRPVVEGLSGSVEESQASNGIASDRRASQRKRKLPQRIARGEHEPAKSETLKATAKNQSKSAQRNALNYPFTLHKWKMEVERTTERDQGRKGLGRMRQRERGWWMTRIWREKMNRSKMKNKDSGATKKFCNATTAGLLAITWRR